MNAELAVFGVFALLSLLGGVVVVAFSYGQRRRYGELAKLATTTGKVVRVSRNNDRGGGAIIEYQDLEGTTLSNYCALPRKLEVVGAEVTVAYDPVNPAGRVLVKERAEDVKTGWIVGAIFMGIGAIMLAITILDTLGGSPP